MVDAFRPSSLDEAFQIIERNRIIPLAGGTDLMVQRRRWAGLIPRFELPVLFIGHLQELREIKVSKDGLGIGPCCTYTALLSHESIPDVFKLCISNIASPAIRNIGTIGGNICNASPAGDTLPVLYALDASVELSKNNNRRTLPIEKFIKGPGMTELEADELLTRIIVPQSSFSVVFYRKVGTRASNSLSKLSFVGLAKKAGGKIEEIRIAFGAASPTAVRSKDIENEIIGKTVDEVKSIIPEILAEYSALINPISDQRSTKRYRKAVSLKLLSSFLKGCIS